MLSSADGGVDYGTEGRGKLNGKLLVNFDVDAIQGSEVFCFKFNQHFSDFKWLNILWWQQRGQVGWEEGEIETGQGLVVGGEVGVNCFCCLLQGK